MTKLPDETLMAYADGMLSPADSDRIKWLAARDPALRAGIEAFRATGPELARVFDEHVNAPIPDRISSLFAQQAPAPVRQQNRAMGWNAKESVWRLREMLTFRPAFAAAAALAAGLVIGWFVHGNLPIGEGAPGDLVQVENHRLIARAPLQQALETVPSGGQVALAGGETRLVMTFQNEAGDYCRQYEISKASLGRQTGIACRSGSQWLVAIQALLPLRPSSDATRPASGGSPMDAAISAMMAGDPLDPGQEADILRTWGK
jgi:hypothetical protein